MKVLVLGSKGQMGTSLYNRVGDIGEFNFLDKSQFNALDVDMIRELLESHSPDLIINCIAFTAVDLAETDKVACKKINTELVKELVKYCKYYDCILIHISSDFVFDGQNNTPYLEDSSPNPLNVYGETKLKADEFILDNLEKAIIFRTSWVFGPHGNNFFRTMFNLGCNNKFELSIVGDQLGCPTYSYDLADAILESIGMIKTNTISWGLINFCGLERLSWYEFALEIFRRAEIEGYKVPHTLNPIKALDYSSQTQRPSYSVLSMEKFTQIYKTRPMSIEQSVQDSFKRLIP